jgi:hypothetical protein
MYALQESFRHSYYFLVAMPLLSGSIAAAISRLSHEYRKAAAQIRWLAIAAPVALLGLALLYVRAAAYGPFAKGGTQRAFLGATFGMSVPEVERAVDRRLIPLDTPTELPGGVSEWFYDLVSHTTRVRTQYLLPDLQLVGAPCQARLDFFGGRLAHVQIEFDKVPHDSAPGLAAKLRDELGHDYQPIQISSPSISSAGLQPSDFKKDDVEAHLLQNQLDAFNDAIAVELTYLPLVQGNPLRADNHVF